MPSCGVGGWVSKVGVCLFWVSRRPERESVEDVDEGVSNSAFIIVCTNGRRIYDGPAVSRTDEEATRLTD